MATPGQPNRVAPREGLDAATSARPAETQLANVISSPGVSTAVILVTLLHATALVLGSGQSLLERWWQPAGMLFGFFVARSLACAHIRVNHPPGDATATRVERRKPTIASLTGRLVLPVAALCVAGNLASRYFNRRAEDAAARGGALDDTVAAPSPVPGDAGDVEGGSHFPLKEHMDLPASIETRARVGQLWRRELILAAEPRSSGLPRQRRPVGALVDARPRASGGIWVKGSTLQPPARGSGPDATAKPVIGARDPGPRSEISAADRKTASTSEYIEEGHKALEYQGRLKRVLAHHKQKLHRCYEQRRERGAKGRLGVVFTFSAASGKVQECTVIDDEIKEKQVRDCVCQEILGWWLPRDEQASGLHTVRKGWNFSR